MFFNMPNYMLLPCHKNKLLKIRILLHERKIDQDKSVKILYKNCKIIGHLAYPKNGILYFQKNKLHLGIVLI